MSDVGTIKMRSPDGRKNSITVSRVENIVNIHFARTSEGEALMRLPIFAASQLAALLKTAAEMNDRADHEQDI